MSKSFQRLASVLKLEAQQNYKNKAVVGGIYQFVSFWVSQARDEAIDEADRAFVEQTADLLSEYHHLPGQGARKKVIDRLIEKLAERQARVDKLTESQTSRSHPLAQTVKSPQTPPTNTQAPAPSPTQTAQTEDLPANRPPKATHKDVPAENRSPQTAQKREPKEQPTQKPANQAAEPKPDQSKREKSQESEPVTPDPEGLARSVQTIKGIGPKIAEQLDRIGVRTIEDMLFHFPWRYDDYSAMKPINRLAYGEQVTLIGTVWDVHARKTRNNQVLIQATISDGTGKITANWYNQPWLTQKLKSGLRLVLSGKVEQYLGRKVFNAPQWELLSMDALRTGRIVPVYPLTQGLGAHKLRQLIAGLLPQWTKKVADPLPAQIRSRQKLMPLHKALREIHQPSDRGGLLAARKRLIFDEMFLLQLGMLGQRREWVSTPGIALRFEQQKVDQFINSLPYSLTGAQARVIEELLSDLSQSKPMNRMLQGDVGAGKTVVAAAAMVAAVSAGTQAALMAPTEILAEQHYQGLKKLMEPLGIKLFLLTGRAGAVDRRNAYLALADGSADIVVGTHALIQEDVEFHNLGLAIIDEQHRFGVDQRKALRDKGPSLMQENGTAAGDTPAQRLTPHLLVMSATPIPRSLALTLFGDLDLSILDEMPPGRQEIDTHWLKPAQRERCYAFVRGQIEAGRQAYIICPLVEESEKIDAASAVEEYERLSKHIFPDLNLGLVHGKLKGEEKETVMQRFYDGELNILVSTTVIEVGVDVPNSTVIVIENANRFGLAQLHQLRGRVGRGEHKSYCLLLAEQTSTDSEARLKSLTETNDGFQLAEKDLEIRGPGEFFGRRQSGIPELKLASFSDTTMLTTAREEAHALFEQDPNLVEPENHYLRDRVKKFWENAADIS